MKILLDTHAFIWFDSSPKKLSQKALAACLSEDNQLFISHVSLWEMQIKHQLGKLTLSQPLPELVKSQQTDNGLILLNIDASHIYGLSQLESHHRDPFDRLLIAQAIEDNLTLMSVDERIQQYQPQVQLLW